MSSSSDPPDTAVPEPEPIRERPERELALIDENWEAEQRRHYADYSGEGERNPELPNLFRTIWSVGAGLFFIGFGIWVMGMGGWGMGPFFVGAIIVLAGIWLPSVVIFKYRQYVRAYQVYQRRRVETLSKCGEPGRTNG